MSEDMLEQDIREIVQTLRTIPESRVGVVSDIVADLGGERGEEWEARLRAVRRQGLSAPVRAMPFRRNEHDHVVITFSGVSLAGAGEIERLEAAKYLVSDSAKACFTSTAADGYDNSHRLVAGKSYKAVLVPSKEIVLDSERTIIELRKLGKKYKYGKSLGGLVPRIREIISDEQMEDMGIRYIASPHEPISGSEGRPYVFVANRRATGPWLHAFMAYHDSTWGKEGAVAFLVP